MKQIIKILYIVILSTLFVSCDKDFLELTPTDKIAEELVWTDQNLVQCFVNAQYNCIQDNLSGDMQFFSDEAYSRYSSVCPYLRRELLTPDNALTGELNYWSTAYSRIRNINMFFAGIDQAAEKNKFDAAAVTQMKAEMSFLRAYIYQILLYSYGGVPIIEKVYELDETLTGVTRNSYQEVFDYIMENLDFVIDNMPDKQSGKDWGRASADVARALKSRLLLRDASKHFNPTNSTSKWQAASDAAWELIEGERYSLWTGDYSEMFYTVGTCEAIWQRTRNSGNSIRYPFWNLFAPKGYGNTQPTENLSLAYEMTNGELPILTWATELEGGVYNNVINPASGYSMETHWQNRDKRWYTLCGYNGRSFAGGTIKTYEGAVQQDASETGYYSCKYIDPNETNWSSRHPYTTPSTMIRYAEILLNYAEAQFELGHEDVAREYLNKVRRRAEQPDVPDTVTGDDLLEKIYHERRVEFPLEGLRYYDIRRWEIAPETQSIPLMRLRIIKNSDESFSYSWTHILEGAWFDKYYNMPIPLDEIQRSDFSLEQNPGY
jgi:hypothetical protein